MQRSVWNDLVEGKNCPLCRAVAATADADDFGVTILRTDCTLLRLCSNQYVRGYSVLISRQHVVEPYQLESSDRERFFSELSRSGAALQKVTGALKMNYTILGNAIPHLHAHLIPRYYGDPAPYEPIDPAVKVVHLARQECNQLTADIRSALIDPQ